MLTVSVTNTGFKYFPKLHSEVRTDLLSGPHAPLVLSSVIRPLLCYLMGSTNHEAPHSLNFLNPPISPSLLAPTVPLSTLLSNTLSPFASLNMRDQVARTHGAAKVMPIVNCSA